MANLFLTLWCLSTWTHHTQAKVREQMQMVQKREATLASAISLLNVDALRLLGDGGGKVDLQASTPEAQLESIRKVLQVGLMRRPAPPRH